MGTYPLPNDRLFALDVDGTKGYFVPDPAYTDQTVTEMSPAELASFVDFGTTTALGMVSNDQRYEYIFVFPEQRDISAFSLSVDHQWGVGSLWLGSFKYSTNTITGRDGTWTDIAAKVTLDQYYAASPAKLRQPTAVTLTGVRGVKVVAYYDSNWWYRLRKLNLWGTYSIAGLELRDPISDMTLSGSHFDLGDTFQGSIYTRDFRIKNNHTLTANNVTIESPANPVTGEIRNTLEFSDGGTFGASVTIPSVAPGVTSAVISARRTVAANATTNNFGTARITASAQSWT